jgi:glutathione peroxidase
MRLHPAVQGLEALYQRYRERGLVVLGFPCNQFGAQEPGDAEEIASFCQKNYGVSFPMFARIEVNGEHAHPLYQYLKKAAPGLLGSEGIKWNFTKFLVDREGEVTQRYAPATAPDAIASDIEALLWCLATRRSSRRPAALAARFTDPGAAGPCVSLTSAPCCAGRMCRPATAGCRSTGVAAGACAAKRSPMPA